MKSSEEARIERILRHPSRRLVIACLFFAYGLYAGAQFNDGRPNLIGLAAFWAVGACFAYLRISDAKFLKSQDQAKVSAIRDTLNKEKAEATALELSRKNSVKEQKQALKSGTETTGPTVLDRNFGWGTVRIYKNGYIFLSTRMQQPEKLVAISSDTSLMNADSNSGREVIRGGAMLTVVTEGSVHTIKEWTDTNSTILTPSKIASLMEIVTVGQSVIK